MSDVNPNQDQNFTEAENKAFQAKKKSMYKGTMAVCIVYGVLALGLGLIAMLSQSGKMMLTTQFNVFVITLVVGILLIIGLMAFTIAVAKPTKMETSVYERDACPDYWKLQPTEQAKLDAMDTNSRFVGQNVCIRDTNVLPSGSAELSYSNPNDSDLATKVNEYADKMKVNGAGSLDCNRLYPSALSIMDEKYYPTQQNKMRCEIADKCGFAWSTVCP